MELFNFGKKKVAFICVHNSCRSQIAEALGKHLAGDKFDFYSAGTETKSQINQDAVRLMKQLYGIDMEQSQYSKTIDKIPTPDLAISMGCDVGCPYIGRAFDDNWELPSLLSEVQKENNHQCSGYESHACRTQIRFLCMPPHG